MTESCIGVITCVITEDTGYLLKICLKITDGRVILPFVIKILNCLTV